ncbi:tryptophan synthase subunit alpha [Fusibacter ferrireducens]|uniref:Tryptophan synthase alpha chain n=1 Tax=Fusibacter ferrireducens TaxID=2785058 RepID=A0ABR9ZRZ9_9FIRM|nr:tryptophan synthase subunit alpha [Fusibacter ferrireducens]MBF4692746.1 tryptophan synthase subunit alpha [Fusibacter ferrireducens]
MKTINTVFENNKKALISYVMVGDGGFEASLDYARFLIDSGIDLLELGMPFSDPAADGETILNAGLRALKAKTTFKDVIRFAETIHAETDMPMVVMTYLNPIYQFGFEKACELLSKAGVQGVIIPDLPHEESAEFKRIADRYEMNIIPLIALTTSENRVKEIVKESKGFIYLVAVKGITGTQRPDLKEVTFMTDKIKKYTQTPVVAGFGIRSREDINDFNQVVDGVVIASRFIDLRESGRLAEIKNIINI